MNCPFCNLHTERTRIIKETDTMRVIFSNPRLMAGHLLVIPKRHVTKLSELTSVERTEIFDLLSEFEEKILRHIAPGCDIRQHYRPFQRDSQLKVSHLHFHLQPRELHDELYQKCQSFETGLFADLAEDEIKRVVETLSK